MSSYYQAIDTTKDKREKYIHRVKCYLSYILEQANTSQHKRDTWGGIYMCLNLWLQRVNDSDKPNPIELIQIYCDNQVNMYTQIYDEYRLYGSNATDQNAVILRRFLNTVTKYMLQYQLLTRDTYFIVDNTKRGDKLSSRKDSDYINLSYSRVENPIMPPHEDLKEDVCPSFNNILPKLIKQYNYTSQFYPFMPRIEAVGPYGASGCMDL